MASRFASIILVGIHTGLRIKSEALALQKSDVDLVRGFLIVRPPMRRTGARAFVFAKRNGTRSRSITKPFRTACEAAGLADVSPYALRHAFASKLDGWRRPGDDSGWPPLVMVQLYTHLTPAHKAPAVELIAQNSPTAFTTPTRRGVGQRRVSGLQ